MTHPLVLVLHGPSLSALGTREPAVYGTVTLATINERLAARAAALGLQTRAVQTNHEGVFIDELLAAPRTAAGVLVNAGAWAHGSLAIADAIRAISVPVVEVHLSNTVARGPERHGAVVGAACVGRVEGFGASSYLLALDGLAALLAGR